MWQFALAPLLHSIAEKDATLGLRKVNTSTGGEREGEERSEGEGTQKELRLRLGVVQCANRLPGMEIMESAPPYDVPSAIPERHSDLGKKV